MFHCPTVCHPKGGNQKVLSSMMYCLYKYLKEQWLCLIKQEWGYCRRLLWGCRMPSMCINIHPLGMGIINPTSQKLELHYCFHNKERNETQRTRCDAAETEMTVFPPLCKSNLKARLGIHHVQTFFSNRTLRTKQIQHRHSTMLQIVVCIMKRSSTILKSLYFVIFVSPASDFSLLNQPCN